MHPSSRELSVSPDWETDANPAVRVVTDWNADASTFSGTLKSAMVRQDDLALKPQPCEYPLPRALLSGALLRRHIYIVPYRESETSHDDEEHRRQADQRRIDILHEAGASYNIDTRITEAGDRVKDAVPDSFCHAELRHKLNRKKYSSDSLYNESSPHDPNNKLDKP